MAATKYQVLHRYINQDLNIPLTNDYSIKYKESIEFITPDHAINYNGSDPLAIEDQLSVITRAEEQKADMITEASRADNPRVDMIFAYNGTKKIGHKVYVPKKNGFLLRKDQWQRVDRDLIGDEGDWDKDFVTLGGATPESTGAIVVLKPEKISKYQDYLDETGINGEKDYNPRNLKKFDSANAVIEELNERSIFSIKDYSVNKKWNSPPANANPNTSSSTYNVGNESIEAYYNTWSNASNPKSIEFYEKSWILIQNGSYLKPIEEIDATLLGPYSRQGYPYTVSEFKYAPSQQTYIGFLKENVNQYADSMYHDIWIDPEKDIEMYPIPEHYENTIEPPYIIKDTYKRVEMSPWIVSSTYGSLEAGLQKARQLVSMIGLNNVQLIKLVPYDQFIKIN